MRKTKIVLILISVCCILAFTVGFANNSLNNMDPEEMPEDVLRDSIRAYDGPIKFVASDGEVLLKVDGKKYNENKKYYWNKYKTLKEEYKEKKISNKATNKE